LISQSVFYDELGNYDPLNKAIAFTKGTEKIFIKNVPEITLAGEKYGPFENQVVELPMAVVMFLLCRNAAKVIE
jgi:hypothetical protein